MCDNRIQHHLLLVHMHFHYDQHLQHHRHHQIHKQGSLLLDPPPSLPPSPPSAAGLGSPELPFPGECPIPPPVPPADDPLDPAPPDLCGMLGAPPEPPPPAATATCGYGSSRNNKGAVNAITSSGCTSASNTTCTSNNSICSW